MHFIASSFFTFQPSDVERVVTSEDGFATFADFAAWSLQHEFCTDLYRMALELGHICLGLKPESQKVEFAVVALVVFIGCDGI